MHVEVLEKEEDIIENVVYFGRGGFRYRSRGSYRSRLREELPSAAQKLLKRLCAKTAATRYKAEQDCLEYASTLFGYAKEKFLSALYTTKAIIADVAEETFNNFTSEVVTGFMDKYVWTPLWNGVNYIAPGVIAGLTTYALGQALPNTDNVQYRPGLQHANTI